MYAMKRSLKKTQALYAFCSFLLLLTICSAPAAARVLHLTDISATVRKQKFRITQTKTRSQAVLLKFPTWGKPVRK